MTKMVLFDFDGTLCDNFHEMMDSFGEVVRRMGKDFGVQNVEILRKQGARAFFSSLDVEPEKTQLILQEIRKIMLNKASSLKLFKEVKEIKSIKNKNIRIGILSSAPKEYIAAVLEINRCDFFDFVIFEDNVFGKDKAIKEIAEKDNIHLDQIFYVGDENRDIDAANKAGVKSVAVTWGYNDEKMLSASKPTLIVRSFSELINLFD